ncbi:MAG: EAL domain-containing protein [Microthrixaceae bacterium]
MSHFKKFGIIGTIWFLAGFAFSAKVNPLLGDADLSGISYVLGSIAVLIYLFRRTRDLPPETRSILRLILTAGTVSISGLLVRVIHGMVIGVEFPLPSIGDAVTLMTYPILIIAIMRIIRKRVGRVHFDLAIDALVAATAAAVVQGTLLIQPILKKSHVGAPEKVVHVLYALMGISMVMAAVMLLIAGSHRSISNRLLGCALILTFVMDNIGTTMTRFDKDESIVVLIAPAIFVLVGLGMLHPSVRLIASRPRDAKALRGISTKRIAVMALTLITPPALMVLFLAAQGNQDVLPLAFGTLLLAPLVLVRLARLVRDREHYAEQEAVLRSVSEALVVSVTEEDIVAAVDQGATELLRNGLLELSVQIPAASDQRVVADGSLSLARFIANSGVDNPLRSGTLVPLDEGQNSLAGLIMVENTCRGLIVISTKSRLDEHTTNGLSALCREAAIALRAVEQVDRSVRERSEERFETLISNSSDILCVLNERWALEYVSSVAERLLGFPVSTVPLEVLTELAASHGEMFGSSRTVLDLVHPEDRSRGEAWLDSIVHGRREPIELRVQHFTGEYSWFEFVGTDLTDHRDIGGIVLNAREINDRKEAEDLLHISEARFKALVQNSGDLVVVVDPASKIVYSSPSVMRTVKMSAEDVLGASFDEIFANHDLGPEFFSSSNTDLPSELIEFSFSGADDQVRIVETTVSDLRREPAIGGIVLNARDVTDRKAMERKLLYQATHDELTGLANRYQAMVELSSILAKSAGATTVALLLLDIDDLKDVNDSLGHEFGDELLIEFASRLRSLLTFGDIAARISGDEFVAIVERSHGEDQIMDIAYELLDEVSEPFHIRGREISISVSAGIAFDHDRHNTAELMLRNADTAMYKAKDRGRSELAVFEAHMHTATFDRLELRADLARAVAHNQLEPFYQPIVDLETNRIVGAEALVRWRHPQRGLVGPNIFIPLAEETGLIGAIGEGMIEKATTDVAAWIAEFGESMERFTISVNLSPQQLRNANLVDTVTRQLQNVGLPASRLVLEVTESSLVTDDVGSIEMMQALRSKGIALSIDDFGTGYSSLGYIQQLEFDVLKIDKSFVDDVAKEGSQKVLATIMDLARNLGVKTVAEGIEEIEQIEALRAMECPYGQGYVYSRPVPRDEFRHLLESQELVPATAS